jgi:very-short-patch-repair endonuclease
VSLKNARHLRNNMTHAERLLWSLNQYYDEERDTFLRRLKFQALRFWNYEILNYPGAVIDYVLAEIKKAKCKNFDHLPPSR